MLVRKLPTSILAVQVTGTAVLVFPVTGTAVLVFLATGTAVLVSPATGTAVLVSPATGTALLVSPATGTAVLVLISSPGHRAHLPPAHGVLYLATTMIERISRERLTELLNLSQGRRVVVVGDAMLDVYLRGEVDRISPEAPVPVVRVKERKLALGGAANVANNIVTIGSRCELVAAVGEDHAGATLREMLRQVKTETRSLVAVGRPTTTKTRVLARSQQLVRYDEEEDTDLDSGEIERLLSALKIALSEADALVLEDYNKGVLVGAVIRNAIEWARARNIPVVVDPKYRNFFAYRGATIFKPNRRELESALGAEVDIDHPEALPATFDRLGVEHLLLTLGERGMALIARDGEVGRIPTTAREVYDVVGAGDTVTAYLAAILAAGGSPAEAAIIANFAAGVEVGKLGAATVTREEVIEAYDDYEADR